MSSIARRWVSRQLEEPLFRAAYSLMANSVITAALGIAYWAVAARVVPSADLGEDQLFPRSLAHHKPGQVAHRS